MMKVAIIRVGRVVYVHNGIWQHGWRQRGVCHWRQRKLSKVGQTRRRIEEIIQGGHWKST